MSADAIFVNGLVWPGSGTAGGPEPTALAVSRGRVLALGSDAEVRELAGPGCSVTDLGGRRVVPGLIDGHLHAVRAGLTWDRELHWTGVPDVATALTAVEAEVARRPAGDWVCAIGGWHPDQFTEARAPSRAELDAVAPEHPVYVQALYEYAVLNTAALRASGLDRLTEDPPGGHVERTADGVPTGRISGLPAFNRCLAALPVRGPEQERASTAAMLRDLHAAGLAGVVDPGGFGMPPDRYDALFELWRRGELTMRMRLFLSAVDPGREYEQLAGWLRHGQTRFGDDVLRTLGVGELIHYGCHDFEGLAPFEISEAAGAEFLRISREAARRRWPMHVHAVLDTSIDRILDAWEKVHAEFPVTGLRFSLAHADRIGPRNIARLRALGAGVVVDDRLVLKAAASARVWGDEVVRQAPPLADLLAAGVPVAAGTDGTRASSYSPWLSLYWLVAGRSLDGVARRDPRHLLGRAEALHLYTRGSAWLSFEEADRGHLFPGALADFAVLDPDYLTVPAEQIPAIRSVLTVVAGTPVHRT